jgi:hypothetical protein
LPVLLPSEHSSVPHPPSSSNQIDPLFDTDGSSSCSRHPSPLLGATPLRSKFRLTSLSTQTT